METSQPLAIESFSYSWLINRKSLDISNESTSEEVKYQMVNSKRFLEDAQNFNFDIQLSKSLSSFVHADEIFSNGQIIPRYVDRSKIEAFKSPNSLPSTPTSSIPLRSTDCFLRKWKETSKKILQKYFGFLKPFYLHVGCSRKCIRVDDIDRKEREVKSLNNSPQASPQRSPACSTSDWCYEMESPIYEAILHCKKSVGKCEDLLGTEKEEGGRK